MLVRPLAILVHEICNIHRAGSGAGVRSAATVSPYSPVPNRQSDVLKTGNDAMHTQALSILGAPVLPSLGRGYVEHGV